MIVYISQIGKNMQFWIKNKYLQIFKLSYPLKLIDAINLNRHLLELCLKKSITHDVMSNFNGKKPASNVRLIGTILCIISYLLSFRPAGRTRSNTGCCIQRPRPN